MIYLDGNAYHVEKNNYRDKPSSPATYSRGLMGLPLVVESGIMIQEFVLTLNVSQPESERLKASFTKVHTTGVYLNYIDERDVFYDVVAGSSTPNHIYNTGVWFETLGEPKPATEALFDPITNTWFDPTKRFIVSITLIVNAITLA